MPRCAPEFKSRLRENIERIYKQNCQNLGLLTSTNFSLIDRIRAGEEIALSEFTAGEDEITRQVIEYGGLFPFNVARMQGKVFLPPIKTAKRPMTLAEKIFLHTTHLTSSETAELRSAGPSTPLGQLGGACPHVVVPGVCSARRHWVHPRRSALQPRIRHADGLRFSMSNMLAKMFR